MQSVEEFIACVFERALGQKIEAGDWSEALFGNWGQLVGSLHAGSRGFEPQHPRWRWQDDGNYAFSARIPPSMPDVRAAAGEALDNMAKLATDPSQFGLVHGDAHPGNYHIQPNGRLTLFDFDDCHYSWLAYDVASVLLSVTTQPWVGASQLDREAEVRRFLPSFVRGYEREAPFAPLIAALPACLKLRELSQFAIIVDQIDAETQASDPFVSRFMQGRRAPDPVSRGRFCGPGERLGTGHARNPSKNDPRLAVRLSGGRSQGNGRRGRLPVGLAGLASRSWRTASTATSSCIFLRSSARSSFDNVGSSSLALTSARSSLTCTSGGVTFAFLRIE